MNSMLLYSLWQHTGCLSPQNGWSRFSFSLVKEFFNSSKAFTRQNYWQIRSQITKNEFQPSAPGTWMPSVGCFSLCMCPWARTASSNLSVIITVSDDALQSLWDLTLMYTHAQKHKGWATQLLVRRRRPGITKRYCYIKHVCVHGFIS